jgi:hypothetical protein
MPIILRGAFLFIERKIPTYLILSTCSITQCDITRDAQTPQQGTLPNIHDINTQSNVEENFHIK